MDSTAVKPERCAQIPILSRLVKKLVDGLDNGSEIDGLFVLVIEMAKEWKKQAHVPYKKVVKLFEEDGTEEHKQLRILFHTLHRKTIRSLVLGMIPYDLSDEVSSNWNNIYSPDGAGTYLVGLSIDGRHGAFLSRDETKKVISLLHGYKYGCETWVVKEAEDAYGNSQMTRPGERQLRLALNIDNTMLPEDKKWEEGVDDYCEPGCMSSGKDRTRNIEALIGMLGRRVDTDVDGGVHQLSSPVYVGCSHSVKKRMVSHDPEAGDMKSSSNVLRLLVSCIRYLGLKVIVHTIPICMVWEESQIPLSEILVTVLAQSLISMNGLNVIQPGTNAKDVNQAVNERMKQHIWVKRPWFTENLEKSLELRTNRSAIESAWKKTQKRSDEELSQLLSEGQRLDDEVLKTWSKIRDAMKESKAQTKYLKEEIQEADSFFESASGMFPDLSDDDESDSDLE
ncbi:hypothetical protein F5Y13DRAFT_191262 [Hypoxylon sp. FL1857]|nr:hypothetical protein F5Y13DRAFT_191262 [Hypoxylon sp. FL1857]